MHHRHNFLLGILFLLALIITIAPIAPAQRSTGTIIGKIIDTPSALEPGVQVELIEQSTGTMLQQVVPASSGSFRFLDVPFATYTVAIILEPTMLASRMVTVRSAVPIEITFDSLKEYRLNEILVEAPAGRPDRQPSGSHTFYTGSTLSTLPSMSQRKEVESMLLSTPGVVPDEDGRLHVRGEDAQLQYVIDGIPVTGNMTRIYSALFDANVIKSADILTGGLNAEYGVAAAGIVAVNTKSGFDRPFFTRASLGGGSFDTQDGSLELGSNAGNSVGYYFLSTIGKSDRYLDPVTSADPNHTAGDGQNYFGKADILLADNIDLNILGSIGNSTFEIPNTLQRIPAQDQKQDINNRMLGAHLNYTIGSSSAFDIIAYTRRAEATITSGGLSRISSSADSVLAVRENEKFFLGGNRVNTTYGGQTEYSVRFSGLSGADELKAGFGAEQFPLHEFFTFAVTNPAVSDPAQPGGDDRYLPYDITRGGHPFLTTQDRTGHRFSAYMQDQMNFGRMNVNIGMRYDNFYLFDTEDGLSPRLGISYAVNDEISLRASYNRIIMQAPVENILVASSAEAAALSGVEQGNTPQIVRSERENNFELGGAYRLNDYLSFDLAGYAKFIDNFIVKIELGNSGIIFPANLKQGLVAGGELRVALNRWNNISGFFSFTTLASMGKIPDDGSSPFASGLFIGEEAESYSHPFAGEDMFPTEHNQLLTSVMNFTYHHPTGIMLSFGGRFDSGLPFDLADSNGVGLSAEASRAELHRRGYSDEVIALLNLEPESPGSPDKSVAPHVTFDAGAGYTFYHSGNFSSTLSVSMLNLFDTRYLYKFESVFGGTHFGIPRTVSVKLDVSY